jgi:hypothetical protein
VQPVPAVLRGGVGRGPGAADAQWFLSHLEADRKFSANTHNVAFSAVAFLFEQVLERPLEGLAFQPVRRSPPLPVVLTREHGSGYGKRAVAVRADHVPVILVDGAATRGEQVGRQFGGNEAPRLLLGRGALHQHAALADVEPTVPFVADAAPGQMVLVLGAEAESVRSGTGASIAAGKVGSLSPAGGSGSGPGWAWSQLGTRDGDANGADEIDPARLLPCRLFRFRAAIPLHRNENSTDLQVLEALHQSKGAPAEPGVGAAGTRCIRHRPLDVTTAVAAAASAAPACRAQPPLTARHSSISPVSSTSAKTMRR